jgi:hypothetical protein
MTSPSNPNSGGLPMTGPLIGQFTEQKVYEGPPGEQDAVAVPSQTRENYAMQLLRRHAVASERLARIAFDKTHPVDEYISTPGIPPPNGQFAGFAYALQLQPSYWMPEKIESLLATIPAGATTCWVKLDDRYIDLLSLAANQGAALATKQTTPVSGASSVAGSNFTYTNNTGAPQEIVSYYTNFNTDATVANRFPGYEITSAGGAFLASARDLTAVVASSTLNMSGFIGAFQNNAATGTQVLALPNGLFIPPGGTFQLVGVAATSADQFTNVDLTFNSEAGSLAQPATVLLDGMGMILDQDDDRFMLIGGTLTGGPTHFELMGYADEIYGNA